MVINENIHRGSNENIHKKIIKYNKERVVWQSIYYCYNINSLNLELSEKFSL